MTQDKNVTISFDYNNMNGFERKRLKDIEIGFTEMGIMFDTYLSEDKCTRYWILKDNPKMKVLPEG